MGMFQSRRIVLVFLFFSMAFASINPVLGQTYHYQGPSGGTGGVSFTDQLPSNQYFELREIAIRAGDRIDGITVAWELADGSLDNADWKGGYGGDLYNIYLYPGEYLVGVSGTYSSQIDSLQFTTNYGYYGLRYGGYGGVQDFNYRAPEGYEIVGFTGREGDQIDALGVIMRLRKGIRMQSTVECTSTPNWVRVFGEIESYSGEPLCAMVLSNGQYMFTCGGLLGRYDLEVPLDEFGQLTIFGFADQYKSYTELVDAYWCRG